MDRETEKILPGLTFDIKLVCFCLCPREQN